MQETENSAPKEKKINYLCRLFRNTLKVFAKDRIPYDWLQSLQKSHYFERSLSVRSNENQSLAIKVIVATTFVEID